MTAKPPPRDCVLSDLVASEVLTLTPRQGECYRELMRFQRKHMRGHTLMQLIPVLTGLDKPVRDPKAMLERLIARGALKEVDEQDGFGTHHVLFTPFKIKGARDLWVPPECHDQVPTDLHVDLSAGSQMLASALRAHLWHPGSLLVTVVIGAHTYRVELRIHPDDYERIDKLDPDPRRQMIAIQRQFGKECGITYMTTITSHEER